MRWLSRLRRWMDRRKEPQMIYVLPWQIQRYMNNRDYRWKRYNGPVHQ